MQYEQYLREADVFASFRYPAGEFHHRYASALPCKNGAVIEAHVRDFEGLCRIVTEDRILRRLGIVVRWFVPYFPFARHDRRNDAVDGFELGLALDLVKEIDIVIADPHSDVSGVLPHIPQSSIFRTFLRHGVAPSGTVIAIPDTGASKKADIWLKGTSFKVLQCRKKRDPQTGQLREFVIDDEVPPECDVVMFDDICDGGFTFTELGKLLRDRGAKRATLCVTHGLFTKGVDVLLNDRIFNEVFSFNPTPPFGTFDAMQRLRLIPFQTMYDEGEVI